MYGEDSFFTLTLPERATLLGISGAMAITGLLVTMWLARERSRWAGGLIGLVIFALYDWLSPQIFYTYYLFIFDGLKNQRVFAWPPDIAALPKLLFFADTATLSAHSRGVLGWALVMTGIWRAR